MVSQGPARVSPASAAATRSGPPVVGVAAAADGAPLIDDDAVHSEKGFGQHPVT